MWNPSQRVWNPAVDIAEEEEKEKEKEGKSFDVSEENNQGDRYMFFTEIAQEVAPMIDSLFPVESGVRVIAEPGRYLVAACATLCCSVISVRSNAANPNFVPQRHNESKLLEDMSVSNDQPSWWKMRSTSFSEASDANVFQTIQDELADYQKLYANQQRTQQDVDAYNDQLDLYKEGLETAKDLLGLPDEEQIRKTKYSIEGMNYSLVSQSGNADESDAKRSGFISLAAAGEAAVSGLVVQCVADADGLQDDYGMFH